MLNASAFFVLADAETKEAKRMVERYLNPREAADFMKDELGVTLKESTLRTMRTRGDGPKFAKVFGKIEYVESDLRAFVETQRAKKFSSTAELQSQSAA